MNLKDITTDLILSLDLRHTTGIKQCSFFVWMNDPEGGKRVLPSVTLEKTDWDFKFVTNPYWLAAAFTLSELWQGIGLGTRMAEDFWNDVGKNIPSRLISIPIVAQFIVDYLRIYPEEVICFNERLLK